MVNFMLRKSYLNNTNTNNNNYKELFSLTFLERFSLPTLEVSLCACTDPYSVEDSAVTLSRYFFLNPLDSELCLFKTEIPLASSWFPSTFVSASNLTSQ